jgi:hypothetical protein
MTAALALLILFGTTSHAQSTAISSASLDAARLGLPTNAILGSIVGYRVDIRRDGHSELLVAYQVPKRKGTAKRQPDEMNRADQFLAAFEEDAGRLLPLGTMHLGYSAPAKFRTLDLPTRRVVIVTADAFGLASDADFAVSVSTTLYQVHLLDGHDSEEFALYNVGMAGYGTRFWLMDNGKSVLLERYQVEGNEAETISYRLFHWEGHDYRLAMKRIYAGPRPTDWKVPFFDFLDHAHIPRDHLLDN